MRGSAGTLMVSASRTLIGETPVVLTEVVVGCVGGGVEGRVGDTARVCVE